MLPAAIVFFLIAAPAPIAHGIEPDPTHGALRGTVIDASTRSPIPCTVSITDANGNVVGGNRSFTPGFRSDGYFEQLLPAGKTVVKVARGFEFRALERVVVVQAERTLDLKIMLERVVDLRSRGWYGGESHAHMNHGERTLPVDFDFVALTARAEDLQYLSLAQEWSMDNPTPEKLERELTARSRPDCVLTWNLEAPKNYYLGDAGRCLGHCWTLGLRGRTRAGVDVIKDLLQASAHDYESDKPSYANFESHQLIHAQGGAVFYTHPARWWMGAWGGQGGYPKQEKMRVSNMAVELPLDTLLGPTFDGIDVITGSGEFEANAMAFELWSLLLNHGYRVAATASSDACFDRIGGATPGVARLYTFVEGGFSLAKVTRAAAQGRNFVTTGPLLLVSMDGKPPGSVFSGAKPHKLQIDAWPSGQDPSGLARLELLRNGQPIQTNSFSPPVASFSTNVTIAASEPGWYCVRLFGSDPRRQRAISGAFFIDAAKHRPPAPLTSKVRVRLEDAATGTKLSGSLTEIGYLGTLPRPGKKHSIATGETTVSVPAIQRLRAEAKGYASQTQSLCLDNPALVEFVTGLSAEDLLDWKTFGRVRSMLAETTLTFRLKPSGGP